MIRKEAWSFYRTSSGVRLCWELEEPKGPKPQGKGSVELTGCRVWGGTQSAVSLQQSGALKMTYCEVRTT